MKVKLYYGAIALIWLLSGCTKVNSTHYEPQFVKTFTVSKHEYGLFGSGMTHLGTCKQCKFELDSIVKSAVNEAFEKYGKEDWNE